MHCILLQHRKPNLFCPLRKSYCSIKVILWFWMETVNTMKSLSCPFISMSLNFLTKNCSHIIDRSISHPVSQRISYPATRTCFFFFFFWSEYLCGQPIYCSDEILSCYLCANQTWNTEKAFSLGLIYSLLIPDYMLFNIFCWCMNRKFQLDYMWPVNKMLILEIPILYLMFWHHLDLCHTSWGH